MAATSEVEATPDEPTQATPEEATVGEILGAAPEETTTGETTAMEKNE